MIDLDNLTVRRPVMHADLPAGGQRYLQPVSGYLATVVGGVQTRADDQDTGERPVSSCGRADWSIASDSACHHVRRGEHPTAVQRGPHQPADAARGVLDVALRGDHPVERPLGVRRRPSTEQYEVLLVKAGATVGLVLAHGFASWVSTRIMGDVAVEVGPGDLLLVQIGGALAVAGVSMFAILVAPTSVELQAARLTVAVVDRGDGVPPAPVGAIQPHTPP